MCERSDMSANAMNGQSADNTASTENGIVSPFIYALQDFSAFQTGQLTVKKDEPMQLLSDDHWYWWYVRKLRDSTMGFIPAELIELPNERLARMNSEWNIELAAPNLPKMVGSKPLRLAVRCAKSVRFIDELNIPSTQDEPVKTSSKVEATDRPKETKRKTHDVSKGVDWFHQILIF